MNMASNASRVRVSMLWLSAVAIALMLVVSNTAPATAQSTATVMVSNLGEAEAERSQRTTFGMGKGQAYAHSFTTGSTAVTLEKVRLYGYGGARGPAVTIRADSSGQPGRSLHALTNPSIGRYPSTNDFTTDGYLLAANTTYWLVIHRQWRGSVYSFSATLSENVPTEAGSDGHWCVGIRSPENGATGEDGWSLGDNLLRGLGSKWRGVSCWSLRMGIYASANNQAANSPATGGPDITGTVWAGETLTATTDGIEDEDGLTYAFFSYQWVRQDMATFDDTDIEGATGSTYTVTDADEGKAIKVRVTFTDDAGNGESLTSYAKLSAPPLVIPDEEETPDSSEAREAEGEQETPLTATIHDAPESHDGQEDFSFELRFSEEPKEDFSYKTLKDHAFTVTGGEVDGARRLEKGKNIRWQIRVEPGSSGDVTVVLPATTDCEADGAVCTDDGRMLSGELKLTVSGPDSQQQAANTPATGEPAISGMARVGETLTADTSGIADEDGLTNVSYSYQWVADDTDIDGATDSSYTLSEDDVGKTINVRVSFEDDAGNEESLTSAATATAAARPSLTASVLNAPQSHNGSDDFTFRITFSEELETDFSFTTLKDHAFTVTGGQVDGARRLVSGSNIRWEITVSPDSNSDVTVKLPATEDCGAQGAICTEDGRMLSEGLEFTVSGPSG